MFLGGETFLPREAREMRARDFEHLKQGDSVMDYWNEFLRLSKYAPHLVSTPHLRVSRLPMG